MTKQTFPIFQQEPMAGAHHHHLVCWKSVVGGVLVSLLAFMMLTSLGASVAGFTAENLIDNESSGSTLASGAGLWLGLSVVISLFCGGYFALRISRFLTNKIGAAHGIMVASISFILLVMGAGSLIGGAAQGIGKLAQGAGQGATGLSSSPAVQDAVNRALGTQLKSDPKDVAQGLAVRLLQGDTESAKAYYAYQTGLPAAEVDVKIAKLKTDFDQAVKTAAEKSAHAVGDAGLMLFVLFLVGLAGAIVGGRVGAHANNTRPFAVRENENRYSTSVAAART